MKKGSKNKVTRQNVSENKAQKLSCWFIRSVLPNASERICTYTLAYLELEIRLFVWNCGHDAEQPHGGPGHLARGFPEGVQRDREEHPLAVQKVPVRAVVGGQRLRDLQAHDDPEEPGAAAAGPGPARPPVRHAAPGIPARRRLRALRRGEEHHGDCRQVRVKSHLSNRLLISRITTMYNRVSGQLGCQRYWKTFTKILNHVDGNSVYGSLEAAKCNGANKCSIDV
ncbi:hypothetical protein CEXT_751441 [Caerostris extrusa]|uniref:Uncharacterized protein n=1 Tax=Caerostris extrusa TaxID=172846 RepID=A0AAV4N6G1_CAEEX|nr:hypothetical protein CEXT_751441 [Caerostris extrusa]